MKEQGIEEVFKSAFDNFEADVDPSVWTNVQQAINSPSAPAGQSAQGSVAGKAAAVAGKLGVKAMVAIVSATVGLSVGAYLILSEQKPVAPAQVQAPQATEQVMPQQEPASAEAPVAELSITPAAAPAEKKIIPAKENEQAMESNAPVIDQSAAQPAPAVAANNTVTGNSGTKPSAITKPHPVATPHDVAADEDPGENAAAPTAESHIYKNDFADIADYLEQETAAGKKALPNIFTPNGDGVNDVFKIKTKNLLSLTVLVFDQSGKSVFQWNGLDGGWDGYLPDGRPAAVGNYYYSVLAETIDGKRCIANSSLMLRRQP